MPITKPERTDALLSRLPPGSRLHHDRTGVWWVEVYDVSAEEWCPISMASTARQIALEEAVRWLETGTRARMVRADASSDRRHKRLPRWLLGWLRCRCS